jgi:hypothetical protein
MMDFGSETTTTTETFYSKIIPESIPESIPLDFKSFAGSEKGVSFVITEVMVALYTCTDWC